MVATQHGVVINNHFRFIIDNQQTIIADDTVPLDGPEETDLLISKVGGADRAPHMDALIGKTV